MPHNPRVADTELPVDPPGNDRRSDVQIRTFLIADVRGYTLFTQEGSLAGGAMRFVYLDGSAGGAPHIELLQLTPELVAFFDSLKRGDA